MERGRGIEPLALAWKAKVLPLYEPRINKFMRHDDSENISLLYNIFNKKLYQETKSYTNVKTFTPDPLLNTPKKEFVIDKFLHPDQLNL